MDELRFIEQTVNDQFSRLQAIIRQERQLLLQSKEQLEVDRQRSMEKINREKEIILLQIQEERKKLEKEKNDFEHLKKSIESRFPESNVIALNVGGKKMTTLKSTLCKYQDSMLAVMFSGRHVLNQDEEERIFIDRDPSVFSLVLEFLRNSEVPVFKDDTEEMKFKRELDFFGLSNTVICTTQHRDVNLVKLAIPFVIGGHGIIYYLSTNGYRGEWANPHMTGVVTVMSSSHCANLGGPNTHALIVNTVPTNCLGTDDEDDSWIQIDFGQNVKVQPDHYLYVITRKSNCHPRNWNFEGSVDRIDWAILSRHINDATFDNRVQTASFPVSCDQPYRYFRIHQQGKTATGGFGHLICARIELYGFLFLS